MSSSLYDIYAEHSTWSLSPSSGLFLSSPDEEECGEEEEWREEWGGEAVGGGEEE